MIISAPDVLSKNSGLTKLDLDTRIKPIYNEFEQNMEPLKTNTTLTSLSLKRYTSKREWEEDDDFEEERPEADAIETDGRETETGAI